MHLMIPYAASLSEGCQSTLPTLHLPHLQKLLPRLSALPLDTGDEFSLSPPHERALAQALGLPSDDGLIPWAARQAQQQPALAELGGAWAFVTLCNWQAHMKEVTLRQMPMQDLPGVESDALLQAMQPFFAEDGLTLHPFEPGCWLAHGAVFATLPTAAPERAQGRDLTPWMPRATPASGLMRLLSEMQMLLYTHPINDTREARGALPVNAFWFHGTGTLPPATNTSSHHVPPTVVNTLRDAALREDWPIWAQAWTALDATQGQTLLQAHTRGETIALTLCGERHARTWHTQPPSLLQRVKRIFSPQPLQNILEQL